MSPGCVRIVAAVLTVVLTTGCGSSLEELRPDEPVARAPPARQSAIFMPRTPRLNPWLAVSDADLQDALRWILPDVRSGELHAEWHRIVSDARFHGLRAQLPRRPDRILLADGASGAALEQITRGYQQWCREPARRGRCIVLPADRTSLDESEVYEVAFDVAMGARWDGFTRELKTMVDPSTLRFVILTGLVVFMACLAIPELTTKIPAAIATAVLTAYLGAQAVCDLVFGWIQMVREVGTARNFDQVREAGERYGALIGAETARILVMLAMAAISEGGVVAKLMKLPQAGAASAALAAETGGVGLESVTRVSGVKVLQGGVSIVVDGVSQGSVGMAMAGRGGTPTLRSALLPKPPQKPVDIKLRYKAEWTEEQRAGARAKVAKLNEAEDKMVVRGSKSKRSKISASATLRKHGYDVPEGCEGDHCVDLQLNGRDTLSNLWPLDSSVNRSLGAQIQQAIKELPPGTPIGTITIE